METFNILSIASLYRKGAGGNVHAALVILVPFAVCRQIERQHTRQNEHIILTGSNINAIGLAQREPALRDSRNNHATLAERILMLKQRPGDVQIVGSGDIDRKAIDEWTDEMFAHLRQLLSPTRDLVGRT